MPKDFKIGMLVGLVLVIGVMIWLSKHPSLSARAIIPGPENNGDEQDTTEHPNFLSTSPSSRPVIAEAESERKEVKAVEGPRYHTVRNGETLSGISFLYYGSETKWQKILDANRNIIKDVKNLKPETKLIIPE